MNSQPPGNGTLTYRVSILEKELEKLELRDERHHVENNVAIAKIEQDIAVLRTEFAAFTKSVGERLTQLEKSVSEDVKGLRKVLIGAGITVLLSAISFAITSLAVLGGPG